MNKMPVIATVIGMATVATISTVSAEPPGSWRFEAYGGFSGLNIGDFPETGYEVLLTPLPPRDHRDMGAFFWSELSHPSILAINQKEPLIHGQEWKAPGRYYGEKNPVQSGETGIHGVVIGDIRTNDGMGEVIGWVTHYNNPTPKGFDNGRVAVNYHLRLFDPVSNELVWYGNEMSFLIEVFETNNYDECCPDGNLNGDEPNQAGCADRFRVGVLEDLNGNGLIDADDLRESSVFSTFDKPVGQFEHNGVEYEVSLTGFWENGENGSPVLTGVGWSPEYEFVHFEVRAEVYVKGQRPQKAGTTVAIAQSCEQPG